MLRQINVRQLNEWRAYADLEPFDEERADLRAATIVQTLLNVHRPKGKPAIKLKDCVLRFKDDGGAQSLEQRRAQVLKTMDMLALMFPEKKPPRGKPVEK